MKTLIAAMFAALFLAGSASAQSYVQAVGARTLDAGKHLAMAPAHVFATPIAWGIDFERAGSHAAVGITIGAFVMPCEVVAHAILGSWRLATFPFAIPSRPLKWETFILGSRPLTSYRPDPGAF
jgi:hypothetical protein